MSGPVAKSLVLSDHERSVLAGWIRRPTSSARLVQRSQIVMAYADSGSVADVARRVGVSAPTVSKWRDRFLVNRLDGLEDAPRPGQPRKLTDEQIELFLTIATATAEFATALLAEEEDALLDAMARSRGADPADRD